MKNKYTNWKDEVIATYAYCPSQERLNQYTMCLLSKIKYWHNLGILNNIDYLIFKQITLSVQAVKMFIIEDERDEEIPDFRSFGGDGMDLIEDDFEELEF